MNDVVHLLACALRTHPMLEAIAPKLLRSHQRDSIRFFTNKHGIRD
jgi:hypothetical protein